MLAGGVLLLAGCASTQLKAERAPDYELESAKTYAWITDELVLIGFGEGNETVRTKDNETLIRAAIDRELAAKGLTLVSAEEAELLVAFSVGLRTRYRLEGGPGTAVTMDGPGETQTEGTLNVYLADRVGGREVWHGWATKRLNKGDDPKVVIDTAVSGILGIFPGTR
ncbi:MAG: DUF4136 domain-containing protein [Myxococcota bacterium]